MRWVSVMIETRRMRQRGNDTAEQSVKLRPIYGNATMRGRIRFVYEDHHPIALPVRGRLLWPLLGDVIHCM